MIYRTKDGDVLDALCKQHYGDTIYIGAVLDANPRLAAYGPVLPAGVLITFPDLDTTAPTIPQIRPQIRLWD